MFSLLEIKRLDLLGDCSQASRLDPETMKCGSRIRSAGTALPLNNGGFFHLENVLGFEVVRSFNGIDIPEAGAVTILAVFAFAV